MTNDTIASNSDVHPSGALVSLHQHLAAAHNAVKFFNANHSHISADIRRMADNLQHLSDIAAPFEEKEHAALELSAAIEDYQVMWIYANSGDLMDNADDGEMEMTVTSAIWGDAEGDLTDEMVEKYVNVMRLVDLYI